MALLLRPMFFANGNAIPSLDSSIQNPDLYQITFDKMYLFPTNKLALIQPNIYLNSHQFSK